MRGCMFYQKKNIYIILACLLQCYWFITPDVLAENITQVKKIKYNVSEHLVTVYNTVEERRLMVEVPSNPFVQEQPIPIAIQIIKNTDDFKYGLKSWLKLPPLRRT